MNIVFYALVLVAFLSAAWNGAPVLSGEVRGDAVAVTLPAGAAVSPSSQAEVTVGGIRWPGTVRSVDKGVAVVTSMAPEGPATVRLTDTDAMKLVGKAALDGAKASVDLAISLVGAMTLFLGLMKVVEAAGGLDALARLIRPVMVRLFPDVPPDHPAMGAMILNLASNVLGLGNIATPFGIKAMQELEKLNKTPGTATNAMVLFLAINTSGVAVLPTGVIALRASLGSHDPAAIFVPTLVATSCSTIVAVISAKLLARVFPPPTPPEQFPNTERLVDFVPVVFALAALAGLVTVVYTQGELASAWIIPVLIVGMLTVGVMRGVKIYETFIEGARDGFQSAIRIIPYLVAILTAVGMFRASGAMDRLVGWFAPVVRVIGMPPEVLPLALLRPLSGSGAFALTGELTKTYGPDSLVGQVAGTLQGSTETTFYVLAVYFGAVGIVKSRHAVATGLLTDIAGAIGAILAVHWLIH
jgi:spore maturation protein SpmA